MAVLVYRRVRPSQVMLDPENPRLPDGTANDREAINRLLDDGAEGLINLARDIAKKGRLDPTNPPVLLQLGSKYLVLEGNRRFAALKLLNDPTLADGEEHQKAFRRAASLGKPPATVFAHITESRAEAEEWIVLRHTGENRGVGVKRWSAEQVANQRRRAKRSVDSGTLRSIAIADELEEAYAADSEMVELIRATRSAKLTNIGRFFSSDVMKRFYLTIEVNEENSIHPRTLHALHNVEQLRALFIWSFDFILHKSVDFYKNKEARVRAIDEIVKKKPGIIPRMADASDRPKRLADTATYQPGGSHSTSAEESAARPESSRAHGDRPAPEDSSEASSASEMAEGLPDSGAAKTGRSGGTTEAKRERFLLQGLKLPNHSERVQRLLMECRTIEMDTLPGVACIMLRVLVELSVSSKAALALSGADDTDPLSEKILKMLHHLDSNIDRPRKRDEKLAHAYFEVTGLGVEYLHAFIHNSTVEPDPHLARRFSSAFRHLLERVDAELK